MRWIEERDEFKRIFLTAKTCVYVDSGREPTTLQKLTFDDAEICTGVFAVLLQSLIEWSGDTKANYIVLHPDPVYYFHHYFQKYPLIEMTSGDSAETYLAALNESLNGSSADAIGTNWWECVIVPPSRTWFVHAMRSDRENGGHLWIPQEWICRVLDIYPYVSHETST